MNNGNSSYIYSNLLSESEFAELQDLQNWLLTGLP